MPMLPEGFTSTKRTLAIELFANASPSGILAFDRSAHCVFVNKRWCELTGTSVDENLGQGWLQHIAVINRKAILEGIRTAAEGQTQFAFSPASSERTLTIRLTVYQETEDHTQFIIGWVDESSSNLASANHKFTFDHRIHLIETVLDSTISMISVIDRKFNIIYYNQQVEIYTGVGKDMAVGQNIFDVFPFLHQTDFKDKAEEALSGKTVQSAIEESILQRGKYFESFYIPLRNERAEIEGVIIKVRDRTIDTNLQQQLMQTNKLLEEQNKSLIKQSHFIQSLFDSTIDVIAVIDKNLNYLSINKRAVERYGFTREQIQGKNILELFPSVRESGMYRDIQRALDGEFVYDLAYTSKVLNKSQFENYYVPLRDENDEVYAVMIIGHDITDIMRANEQLKISNRSLIEKNRDLERSNNDLEQFAYVASHDLQEPIRKIATYSNKLLTRSKEQLSEETTVYLQRISSSTRRMYELINGLLTYSRLTREEDLFTKTSLEDVFRQVISDYDLKVRDKKAIINFQNRLPEIDAIPIQMHQLFANLISNSLKFARKDVTPVIQIASLDLEPEQIEFYNLDPRGTYVTIFYLDNGIGFDQQFAEKVFEIFQRLHERNKYEGSGIGLAICKKIISNHHGMISVFSEEGKGTTFQMILPYSQKIPR